MGPISLRRQSMKKAKDIVELGEDHTTLMAAAHQGVAGHRGVEATLKSMKERGLEWNNAGWLVRRAGVKNGLRTVEERRKRGTSMFDVRYFDSHRSILFSNLAVTLYEVSTVTVRKTAS